MSTIGIVLGSETVGTISFIQPESGLSATRTAWGLRLMIPTLVTFWPPADRGLPLVLENLRVTFAADSGGKQIELGVASSSDFLSTPMKDSPVTLSLDLTLQSFAFYESLRDGREPRFRLQLCGNIRYIIVPEDGSRTGREPCSIATSFYRWGEVGYSKQVWTKMMRDLCIQDAILLEIPFPEDPPTGWEPVWTALRDARNSFDTGGSTGWKNSVASARLALEEWRKIEKEDQGPGWQAPKTADLQSRTKAQRIDTIRWHLIQVAHYAAHTSADEWTRDDALLILSTLCSLLGVRKP